MSTLSENTKLKIEAVEAYLSKRALMPEKAGSNSECNSKFTGTDVHLATIWNDISLKVGKKQLKSYGVSMHTFQAGSGLLKDCCDCPGNPHPYTTKNSIRKAAEDALKVWLRLAKLDFEKGAEMITETSRPIEANHRGRIVKTIYRK